VIESTGYRVRAMVSADVAPMALLDAATSVNHWSPQALRDELGRERALLLVAEVFDGLVPRLGGFLISWVVCDELQVLEVAVHPTLRRKGLGRFLLNAALHQARARQADRATLEVRGGNEAAVALYLSTGFRVVGVRPGYYTDNQEDALLMNATLV
jgi:ribosomal-protein-alanine N-acetyltransferase